MRATLGGFVLLVFTMISGCGDAREPGTPKTDSERPNHAAGSRPSGGTLSSPTQSPPPQTSPPPSPRRGGCGYYTFTFRGAKGWILLPATATDDRRVAEAEAYRRKAHGFRTTYVVVVVDNTKGSLDGFVDEVDAATNDGEFTADTYLPDALSFWHAPRRAVKRSRKENQIEVQLGQWTNAVLASEYPLTGEPRDVEIDFSDSFVHASKLPGSQDCNHPPSMGK